MKKNNKGTKKPKKQNKLYITLDMSDMNKMPSQVILESKKDLGMVQETVEEVINEIVTEVTNDIEKNEGKKVHWYNKLWNTIKSLF